jgi:Putative dehydrogenase domain of multifunctional non-ribosomal peptide synthetases and related enzymes
MADRGSQSGPITEWFKGRSVLVTGATGFMGKVLVEKLMRSCPDIATIYLLMRPKRGNDIRMRLDELLHTTVSCSSPLSGYELTANLPPCLSTQHGRFETITIQK